MSSVSEDLLGVARRVIWFENPEDALRYRSRFLAYVMTYGTVEDIVIVRHYFHDDEFRQVLIDPPSGIFDPRSWTYWNLVYGRNPAPPMPRRLIPTKK